MHFKTIKVIEDILCNYTVKSVYIFINNIIYYVIDELCIL